MMNNKELFSIWAPSAAEKWTRFAKPALFVKGDDFAFLNGPTAISEAPFHIKKLTLENTMIVIDLPGATSVENGLRLAKIGYQPVPLFNGIHETKTYGLSSVINNQPIIDGLIQGASLLKDLTINETAGPAFLLDYDRNKEVQNLDLANSYDNRWSVDFEDFPDAMYLKNNSISKIVLWTEALVQPDLSPILDSYRDAGIVVMTYTKGKFETVGGVVSPSASVITKKMQEKVRKFENARFGLSLLTMVAFAHLFFMFFVMDAPLIYTTPSIMWMTYLWVSYNMANFLAIVFPVIYLIFYFKSEKDRRFMPIALAFFGVDVIVFYSYVFFFYGVNNFTEGYFYYGLFAFVPPLIFLAFLIQGTKLWHELKDVSDATYLTYLNQLDDPTGKGSRGGRGGRRRYRGYRNSSGTYRYRGYNGYSGYGGSGKGGYKGSGYRGSGGYGGGFGG